MNEPLDASGTNTVRVIGRLDAASAPELGEKLRSLHAAGCQTIVIDLAPATYISSSGLRVLLMAHKRQQMSGGTMILQHTAPKIMRIMKMCGFDRIFSFTPLSPEHCP